MRRGFLRIFWGLLLVELDVRVDHLDLLPDFVGYILIFTGLGLLSSEHRYFRKARPMAFVLIFLSIPSLFKPTQANIDAGLVRRQVAAAVTHRLANLLPNQVGSARLVRSTSSQSEIDSSRTHNPAEGEDKVLGEYSDGTRVLILRYRSAGAAVAALREKAKAEYSADEVRKRLGLDPEIGAASIHTGGGESSSGDVKTDVSASTTADSLDIEQWWNLGWVLWSPSTWSSCAGWSRNTLFVVEGYPASANRYKTALGGNPIQTPGFFTGSPINSTSALSFPDVPRSGSTVNLTPAFPFLMIGSVLEAVLICLICLGIIAMAEAARLEDLANIARGRLALYIISTVAAALYFVVLFAVPGLNSASGDPVYAALIVIRGLVMLFVLLLMLKLVRTSAEALGGTAAPISP